MSDQKQVPLSETLALLLSYHDEVGGIHDRIGLYYHIRDDEILERLRRYARRIEDKWSPLIEELGKNEFEEA